MDKNSIVSAEAGCENLLPEQVKALKNYNRDNVLNSLSKATCNNKIKDITLFAKAVKKPFDQVNEEDIKNYISSLNERLKDNTLSVKKRAIKCFFKWFCKSEDYPAIVSWIKTGYAKSKHRLPESILTPEDVKSLIDAAKTVQHKAIIAVLYDTAVRAGEFLNMNINEVQYDENGAFIFVNGKTGQRIVRIIHSQKYLSAWLEYHHYNDKIKTNKLAKYPLWVSESTRSKGKRLTQSGISGLL